jgi:hypothetical protein
MGDRSLRTLFSHVETARTTGGRQSTRTVTPYAVDGSRLLGFLPRQAAASWNEPSPRLPDRDGYLAANREVMEDLHRTARTGQLLVSRRARYVLDRMYGPTAQQIARAAFDEMSRSRVPFALLEKLRAPRIQEILGRLPSRTVCLALVGAHEEMALVRRHTSRSKAALLAEELAVLERRIDDGSLDLAEAVAARRAVAEEIRRIAEIEQRERSKAAGARRADRRS